MKTYVTFGQAHFHLINGVIFDKDCVAVVEGGRKEVFELFGPKFFLEYTEAEFDHDLIKFYSRGFINV